FCEGVNICLRNRSRGDDVLTSLQMPPQIRIDKRTLAHRECEDHQEERQRKDVAKCALGSHLQGMRSSLRTLPAFDNQVTCTNNDYDNGYHGHGVEMHRDSPLAQDGRAVLL